jgi:8-amino-7-oxononanoate synthase
VSGESLRHMDELLLAELENLEQSGLLRTLRTSEPLENSRVIINGKQLISFGSNDYLGLAGHGSLRAVAKDGLTFGAGATGSRLTSGNFPIFEQLEQALAAFKHTDDCLLFSSGFAANVGVIPALVGQNDLILSDSLNHASLIDGCRLSRATVRVYAHADIADARRLLSDRSSFHRLLLVTDGLFSMDGDVAPLAELVELCDEYGGWLMVDDAHGTGVYGDSGSGTVERLGLIGRVHIQMGTLSKALATAGGFVCGSKPLIDYLRNKARSFMFSTAPTPANAAAALAALQLIQTGPDLRLRLQMNIQQMREGLREFYFPVTYCESPIIPLIIGDPIAALRVSRELEKEGIWIPAIRPPTVPAGLSRLRITVTAAHKYRDIKKAVEAIVIAMASTI